MTIRSGKIAFSEYIPARMIHMNSTPGKKKPMSPALKCFAALSVIPCLALSGCVSDKTEPAPPPATESSPAPETCVPAQPETGLHPQAAEFLRRQPAELAARQMEAIREARNGNPAALAPWRLTEEPFLPEGVKILNLEYESEAGPRALRLFLPESAAGTPRAAVLYLHGGGWVLGSIQRCSSFCAELALKTGAAVAAPDYRLAPEAPWPAALDDVLAAYNYLTTNADDYNIDPDRLVLAGDSAGGQLAATAALKEFETTEEKPAGLILFYPVVTLEPDSRESWKRCGKGFNLDADLMEEFNAAYVPDPAQRKEPLVSPLNAAPESFPPVLLVTAEYDILRDQATDFAAGLRKAGVPVRVRRYRGAVHGFITFPGLEIFFRQGVEDAASFLDGLGR